jgi:hypothetical protein
VCRNGPVLTGAPRSVGSLEQFQNRAWRSCLAGALRDGACEHGLNLDEGRNFVTELFQVGCCQVLNVAARRSRWFGKNKQQPDVFNAEFQFTGPANEQQPAPMIVCVVSVSAGCTRRRRHQTDAFVIPDGRNFDPACHRERSDRHSIHDGAQGRGTYIYTWWRLPKNTVM